MALPHENDMKVYLAKVSEYALRLRTQFYFVRNTP